MLFRLAAACGDGWAYPKDFQTGRHFYVHLYKLVELGLVMASHSRYHKHRQYRVSDVGRFLVEAG